MTISQPGATVGIGWRQPHHRELLERRPSLGFLEVHSENFFAEGGPAPALLQAARAHYPVSLHGVGLALGSAAGLDPWHLDQLARLVEQVEPVRVSDHACFARAPRGGGRRGGTGVDLVHANDLLPIAFTPAALDILCSNVQQVQERLRRPLLVENLSQYLHWADDSLPEPEFFRQLTRRTGCGLLLDVNNVVVNALNAGHEPVAAVRRFVAGIDAASVGEIHLAGYNDAGDIVIDDHGSRVHPPVWQAFEQVLLQPALRQVPVLIEWDTEVPALDVLLDEAAQAGALAQRCGQGQEAA
jgi:uncharacterized protein (UPF0276 family)